MSLRDEKPSQEALIFVPFRPVPNLPCSILDPSAAMPMNS
jgi:hypothetical protein